MDKANIYIVEDEVILAEDIKHRLTHYNYNVVGIAGTAAAALEFLSENKNIDVVLIDIVLQGDLDGIELATILKNKYDLPFIFLTSHTDSNIVARAKQICPSAYILKPFNDRQVNVAIEMALDTAVTKNKSEDLMKIPPVNTDDALSLGVKDSLFLKKDYQFERVYLREIDVLQADSNYCSIYTKNKQFMYSMVLKKIEERLPKDQFLRVHRSYVININSVNGFEGNTLFVGKKKVPVSKTYKERVFKLFHTI